MSVPSSSAEPSRAVQNQCNDQTCRADKVGLSGLRTRHAEDGCSCEWASSLLTGIQGTLATDRYVLVDASDFLRLDGTRRLSLVSFTEGMPYVAFSHVRAHGVGGDAEDGLPTCLIAFLLGIVWGTYWIKLQVTPDQD